MRGLAPRLRLASAPRPRLRPTAAPVSSRSAIARPPYQAPLPPTPWPQRPKLFLTTSAPLLSRDSPWPPHPAPPPPRPPLDDDGRLDPSALPKLPFRFDTGIALFAKRTPRPFPPPFLSPPSGSFSDPLSTHDRSRDRRRAYVGGHLIQGLTNGDDAVFASDYFICANDGVGAWGTRPRGHAG